MSTDNTEQNLEQLRQHFGRIPSYAELTQAFLTMKGTEVLKLRSLLERALDERFTTSWQVERAELLQLPKPSYDWYEGKVDTTIIRRFVELRNAGRL